jgi:hypothetical protein
MRSLDSRQNGGRADQPPPHESGRRKTTTLRLSFFKTNEGTSRWFLKPGEKAQM